MKQTPAPDPFAARSFAPMLFRESEPFDSGDYIFELKLDGIRSLAYLDIDKTVLINKRGKDVTANYPELSSLHAGCRGKAVLDGEIVIFKNGKPDFFALQRRSLLSDRLKIKLSAAAHPATFAAFDILYWQGETLTESGFLRARQRKTTASFSPVISRKRAARFLALRSGKTSRESARKRKTAAIIPAPAGTYG